jgi:hypothetical protein
MNGDFFRFWRYIQRFSLGTILFIQIIIIIFGVDKFLSYLNQLFTESNNTLGIINNVAILIVLAFVFGAVGTLIGNMIIGFFSTFSITVTKYFLPLKKTIFNPKWFVILLYSSNDIAIKLLRDNIDEHIEHFSLRSLGEPQPNKVLNRVEAFYVRLKKHLLGIKDHNHFFMLAYQGTLTQEQRNLDNLEWDINSIRMVSLVLELCLVILFIESLISIPIFIFLIPAIFAISIPEFIIRKRKYISYLIGVSGSIFQIAEGADMADRDSI